MHESQTQSSATYEKPVLENLGSLAALTQGDDGPVDDLTLAGSQ